MNNPFFIHGDTVAVSMSLLRGNAIRVKIDEENLYSKFGFCLPVDSESLAHHRYLSNQVHMYNRELCTSGLITSSGDVFEIIFIRADENDAKTRMLREINFIPRTSGIHFRGFDGKTEERIALAISMGYDTIEKLLAVLEEHTHFHAKDYRFFSIEKIVRNLKALKTPANPEEILQEHFNYA